MHFKPTACVANNFVAGAAITIPPNHHLAASNKTINLCYPKNKMRAALLKNARAFIKEGGPSIPININRE